MSSDAFVLRLPRRLRHQVRALTATPAPAEREAPARDGGERRGALADVARDVSPQVVGRLHHFGW